MFAGSQTVPLKAHRKLCCGLGPGVPVGEVALAPGCLLGGCLEGLRVLEGLEGFLAFGVFWRVFGGFGGFWSVWSVCGLVNGSFESLRKPLLWPWPWGACSGSGLGPGVPAGDGVWRVWKVLEGLEGLEGFGSFGKPIESHCCGLGPGVPV